MATETGTAPKSDSIAGRWQKELTLAEKDQRKFWERGRRVMRKFMDESETTSLSSSNVDTFNIFWANVGVLKASLYANPPKPLVKREWNDYEDQVARVAGVMMERLLQQPFEHPSSDMNMAFKQCVEDRLVPGLGQVWLHYEPDIEETVVQPAITGKNGKVLKEAITEESIVGEEVKMDYVYWEDFWWSPARMWTEVRWVARRVWMTKSEFKARFEARLALLVNWTKKEPQKYGERVTPESMGIEKTEVFEIWHKPSKTVYWISKSCEEALDQRADPLEIRGFFPCPKPLLATHTTGSLVPKADYLMVQSQYRRLENLSIRIGLLEDSIRAAGVYDKANSELAQLLDGRANKMVAVDNWAMFAEKGGMKGVVDWFPLDMIVEALEKLVIRKDAAKNELFELTGISDIMRGQTNARETLGAQQLKSQYSSVRLQYLQGETAEFVQEALRIKSEIISKHFQLETIIKNSLIEMTPDAEYAVEAAQLLKDEWAMCYRVQVFADTLAIPDYNAERQGRTEFIQATGQFIAQVMPLIEMEAGAGPFLLHILQWGVSSFRSAATIEGVFSKAIQKMEDDLKAKELNPPPAKPDPKMVVAQAEAHRKEVETQTNVERASADLKRKNVETLTEIAATNAKTAQEIASGRAKTQAEIAAIKATNAAKVSATLAKAKAAGTKK
jgi:hypothetical protein